MATQPCDLVTLEPTRVVETLKNLTTRFHDYRVVDVVNLLPTANDGTIRHLYIQTLQDKTFQMFNCYISMLVFVAVLLVVFELLLRLTFSATSHAFLWSKSRSIFLTSTIWWWNYAHTLPLIKLIVKERETTGNRTFKYHGKWPLRCSFRNEEPMYVALSTLNLAVQFHGWVSFFILVNYKLPLRPNRQTFYEYTELCHIYGALTMNFLF